MRLISSFCLILLLAGGSLFAQQKWEETALLENIRIVQNNGGQTLGYSAASGIKLITKDGFAFKDLNRNGQLDVYEDWRQPFDVRAKDLASKMTIEQIAGLMLYSGHQAVPAGYRGFGPPPTYGGKPYQESGAKPSDLTDQQKKFLTNDNLRHVLITTVESPEVAAKWNNNMQALVEGIGLGIPANTSTDPRHSAQITAEFNAGSGGKISLWPESLGMAATFDPALVKRFGEVASKEYRALGIATALSPQIDLATEPRWNRFPGTFGEDPELAADMARAYVDGFQTSTGKDEIRNGWGFTSVNAMVKHWPGGGSGEAGRDAHFGYGKYAVYPGKAFEKHLVPFTKGAFALQGKTGMAAAVMPYYTISVDQDKVNGENVGNGYSKYLITDLLRRKYKYDGVVCTDWMVTGDPGKNVEEFRGKSWGMETKTVAERHYKVLMAGVDQFGGNNEAGPVLEAYKMGVKEHGEAFMRKRFEQSAVRLLLNIFRTGLFENPYLDPVQSASTVGNPSFMREGYEAQVKSVVMLKNSKNVLPLKKQVTVYMPKIKTPSVKNWFGVANPEKTDYPFPPEMLNRYFRFTDDPAKADVALVFVKGPMVNPGYDGEDVKKGGNGYIPISLQYGDYKADKAREKSIAAGDPTEPGLNNRSYKGKTISTANNNDLQVIMDTKKAMNGKPVVVAMSLTNPAVVAEFEKDVNAILVGFGVQSQAFLDLISGAAEPSALLPFQMPANMDEVELQKEDLPHDMKPHVDASGNKYDFGFGLNWKGKINDARVKRYVKAK
jgi:beta-glucosidase